MFHFSKLNPKKEKEYFMRFMCKYREYLGVIRSVNYRQRRLIYGDDVGTQFVIDRGVILALAIKFS